MPMQGDPFKDKSASSGGASVKTNPKDNAVLMVQSAVANLVNAYSTLVTANPMAADVPAVQRLTEIGKELGPVMQAISRLRGM